MTLSRGSSFLQFNYVVNLGRAGTETPDAGFHEVSGLALDVTVAEYRDGKAKGNFQRKLTAAYKTPDVTLKRGLIDAPALFEWIDAERSGTSDPPRTVTIRLQDEDRSAVVLEWRLVNARPIKYTGPVADATDSEVAIEELVLACERLEIA